MRRILFTSLAALALVIPLSSAAVKDTASPKPIRALLVIGGCCHDYNKQKDSSDKWHLRTRQRCLDRRLRSRPRHQAG